MFTVYVLKSIKTNKRYVGYTEKTINVRLAEHNSGANKWTGAHKPLVLAHTEKFETLQEARSRELFLKSGQGRKFLDQIIPR